jgi:outer membrane lipoprotein-sorting protein
MKLLARFYLLLGILLTGQVACSRLSQSNALPAAPSPSPDQAAIVDQILARYTEAIGGEVAIERVKSYHAKGTFVTSVSPEQGAFETWGKEPNKTLSVIEFPRIGSLKKGFDGETRWVQTPAGTFSDQSSKEMAEVERDADIYRAGRIKSLYQSMRLDSKGRLKGRDVYIVEGTPVKGPPERLLFDTESGLLLRWDMARRDPRRGNVFVKVHLDDYREVDGVKVPFSARFAFESFDFTLKISDLKHNVSIDDAVFKKPGTK